jgi:uncharacterized protein YjaZ
MTIEPINSLANQKAALESGRMEVFRERVMMPLEPMWKPFLGRMPRQEGTDPVLATAQAWGVYSPQDGAEEGLKALEEFERAGVWTACLAAVETALTGLNPLVHGIELGAIQFTLLLGSLRVLREEYGAYTGAQAPGYAVVLGWPNPVGTPRLPVASAHELNHIIRFTYEPWTPETTVGQYMVAEGLAEAFGVETVGDESLVGPYSRALSPEQLETVKPRFKAALETTGFDTLRGYIFGDWAAEQFGYPRQGIPDYAGYTLGYEVVNAYLKQTGKSAAEATYMPWREIVEGSRYFV